MYINTEINFLDITHPSFYLKCLNILIFIGNDVSEDILVRPQVKKENLLCWAQSIELVPISGHQK
jgi:hypothetical protein